MRTGSRLSVGFELLIVLLCAAFGTAGAGPVRCFFPIPVDSEFTDSPSDVWTEAFLAISLDLLREPITSQNAASLAHSNTSLSVCAKTLGAVCSRDWDTYRAMVCRDIPLSKGQAFLYDAYEASMDRVSDYAIYASTSIGENTCYLVDMLMKDGVRRPWLFPLQPGPPFCYDPTYEDTPLVWIETMFHYGAGPRPVFSKSFVQELPFDASKALSVPVPVPIPGAAGYAPPSVIMAIHPYAEMGEIKVLTDRTLAAFAALVPNLPTISTEEDPDKFKRYLDELATVMLPGTRDYFTLKEEGAVVRKTAHGLYQEFSAALPSRLKNMDGAMMLCAAPDYILIPDFIKYPVEPGRPMDIYQTNSLMQHFYNAPFPYWHFRLHQGKMFICGADNLNFSGILSWPAFWDQMRVRFEEAHKK